jgi:hypothetical protein
LNATSLVERVVVVTGAASGIGRQIALDMAAIGARIVAVDRDDPGVEKTCSSLGPEMSLALAAPPPLQRKLWFRGKRTFRCAVTRCRSPLLSSTQDLICCYGVLSTLDLIRLPNKSLAPSYYTNWYTNPLETLLNLGRHFRSENGVYKPFC